jgi:hypothetical protein
MQEEFHFLYAAFNLICHLYSPKQSVIHHTQIALIIIYHLLEETAHTISGLAANANTHSHHSSYFHMRRLCRRIGALGGITLACLRITVTVVCAGANGASCREWEAVLQRIGVVRVADASVVQFQIYAIMQVT